MWDTGKGGTLPPYIHTYIHTWVRGICAQPSLKLPKTDIHTHFTLGLAGHVEMRKEQGIDLFFSSLFLFLTKLFLSRFM